MACSVTQADLGPLFAAVDPALAAPIIAQATIVVLGPADGQAAMEAAYINCGIDPCNMIVLLSQHLLSTIPGAGSGTGQTVQSERVGDVSVSYASAGSSSSLWGGSPFGILYQLELSRWEKCRAKRSTLPRAYGPTTAH